MCRSCGGNEVAKQAACRWGSRVEHSVAKVAPGTPRCQREKMLSPGFCRRGDYLDYSSYSWKRKVIQIFTTKNM